MKATHKVTWITTDGYHHSVSADFIAANALYDALKASPLVREVSYKAL